MLNANHGNFKHQKTNFKQIPMTQIPKYKQMIRKVVPGGIITG